MAKKKMSSYVCDSCGAKSQKWSGKCLVCGEWDTLREQSEQTSTTYGAVAGKELAITKAVDVQADKKALRYKTGIGQLDAVLGGGVVAGSLVLIAGQPGIGKSTLLLQMSHLLAGSKRVLYVSAEESAQQIKLRSQRLGNESESLELSTSTSTDDIAQTIISSDYDVVIIDSIQTIATHLQSSNPGSVAQITASAHVLTAAAKRTNTALVFVGHVTKEGNIAGPKVLEHLVDAVLHLEGDRYGGFKLLRTVKNRFGATNEVGVFEMQHHGLVEVANPSASFLEERHESDGSIVLATLEGSRPMLVEIQALVTDAAYGHPKRTVSGFDYNRLNLLVAMLTRRTTLRLAEKDIFINVVGGLKIDDPAADLAICMAIGSAARSKKLNGNYAVYGEVGLSGEVRQVFMQEARNNEVKKLGFDGAIAPTRGKRDSFVKPAKTVREALNTFLAK